MPAPLAPLVGRWRADLLPKQSDRLVVAPGARAYLVAGMAAKADRPLLVIVPGEREAEDLVDDLELFTEHASLLPAWETLPFEHVSPNVTTMAARARARDLLGIGAPGTILVASVRAAIQRVSPSPVRPVIAAAGKEAGFDLLVERLA
ncbi:MAG: hypothetical protein OEX97_00225, partial [Acidimicrobiia bacterium]|nr:hypothetical protein [Acidimicrobiia bacterium]